MKRLKIMDSTGDTTIEFEPGSTTEAEATTRELFERLMAKGSAVFRIEGEQSSRVRDFAELGQENVVVPAIVAG